MVVVTQGQMATVNRVGHKKSRNGCIRCKQRRVKCDEQRPCHNCVRHGVECSLTLAQPPTAKPPPPILPNPGSASSSSAAGLVGDGMQVDSSSATRSPGTPSSSAAVTAKLSAIRKLADELESEVRSFTPLPGEDDDQVPKQWGHITDQLADAKFSAEWFRSLRLFRHWCESTYETLAFDAESFEAYKTAVPEAALSYDPLMYGLLAVTAIHYAHLHPEERVIYITESRHYQRLALASFRAQVTEINETNWQSYFVLATFISRLSTNSIANPQDREGPITPDQIAQSFDVIRGTGGMLTSPSSAQIWMNHASKGALMPILKTPEPQAVPRNGPFMAYLERLAIAAREHLTTLDNLLDATLDNINARSSCLVALESLRNTYVSAAYTQQGARLLWAWPYRLPQGYLDLVRASHPISLVILAHFAALAFGFERLHWERVGWSASVIDVIDRHLHDQKWREWLAWPLQCVRAGLDVDAVPNS